MLRENDLAPDFTLTADDGSTVRLSELRGRRVLLYFYPKDDTPGCTTQACDLRDRFPEVMAKEVLVLGISPDSPKSHRKFRKKYNLPFQLLSDTDHKVAETYNVWKEKTLFGITYWGNERTSFLIDEEGRIARIFERVKASKHAEQVIDAL
jgi:peroxiredoxin Q/BCP